MDPAIRPLIPAPASQAPEKAKICVYNVGGKEFSFSRATIERIGSIGWNMLSTMYSEQWKGGDRFIDVNPKIFQKWFDPYIRHGQLPVLRSIKSEQEKTTILLAAQALGFTQIQEHFLPKYPEGAFGPEQWEKHYGYQVDDAPPVPDCILQRLDGPCPHFDGKQVSETHVLFLVPKGISLDQMLVFAKNPKEGPKLEEGYRVYWDKIKIKHGNETVKNSYWVLMTTTVIPNSRGADKSREFQLTLASSVDGYQAPSLIEAVIGNLVVYVSSGARLFDDHPWTYTCCREETIDGYKLAVGGFAPSGLNVCNRYASDYVGVAAVVRRKFN